MTIRKYYKSNALEVMSALGAYEAETKAVRAKGKAFADHFGGELLAQNSIHGYSVAGIVFTPSKPGRLWTFPDKQSCGSQHPRASITKATPEEKVELAALKQEWKDKFPAGRPDFAPVLTAMGTSWGNCMFNGGFGMFQFGGFVYVTTRVSLADCMQEILASEYQAAKDAEAGVAA